MTRFLLSTLLGLSVLAAEAHAQSSKRELTDREDLFGWEAIGRLDIGKHRFCYGNADRAGSGSDRSPLRDRR